MTVSPEEVTRDLEAYFNGGDKKAATPETASPSLTPTSQQVTETVDPSASGHYIKPDNSTYWARIPTRIQQTVQYLSENYNLGKSTVYRADVGLSAFAGTAPVQDALALASRQKVKDLETRKRIDGLGLVVPGITIGKEFGPQIPGPTSFLASAANTLPYTVRSLEAGGVGLGLGYAVSKLAGFGPVPVKIAAQVAGAVGIFTNTAVVEGTNNFLDLAEEGVDTHIARKASVAYGAIAGLTEVFEWNILAAPIRRALAKNLGTEAGQMITENFLKAYLKNVGGEVAQEDVQALAQAVSKTMARMADGTGPTDAKSITKMILEEADLGATTAEAFKAMAAMGLVSPAAGAAVQKIRLQGKNLTARPPAPGEVMPDGMVQPTQITPDQELNAQLPLFTEEVGQVKAQIPEVNTPENMSNGPRVADFAPVNTAEPAISERALEENPEHTVKLTNAEADRIAQNLGVELDTEKRKSNRAVYEAAKENGADLDAQQNSVDVLSGKKLVLTPEEHAGLVIREAQLENETEKIQEELSARYKTGETEGIEELNQRLDTVIASREIILAAVKKEGTRQSAQFAARNIAIERKQFSLLNLLAEAQKAKGETLSVEEKQKLAEHAKEIRDLQDKIDKLEKQLSEKKGQQKTKADEKEVEELTQELLGKEVEARKAKRKASKLIVDLGMLTGKQKTKLALKELPRAFPEMLRSLGFTMDLQIIGLQGGILTVNHPKVALGAFVKGVQSLFSQDTADMIDIKIRKTGTAKKGMDDGLFLSRSDGMTDTEETIARTALDNMLDNAKGIGLAVKGVREVLDANHRFNSTYLNILRAHAYEVLLNSRPELTKAERVATARSINILSGRGDFGKAEGALHFLSKFFLAPRWVWSRIQAPFLLFDSEAVVRKEVAKQLGIFASAALTVTVLASMAGAKVNYTDPEKSDWLLIKMGKFSWDVWAGLRPWIRLMLQPVLAGLGSAGVVKLKNEIDIYDSLNSFLDYKLHPLVHLVAEQATGKTVTGGKITRLQSLGGSVTPLSIRNAFKFIEKSDDKALGAALGLLGAVVNLGFYEPRKKVNHAK